LTASLFCCILAAEEMIVKRWLPLAIALVWSAVPTATSRMADEPLLPAAGVHTLRADDALLRLASDGGFTWLVQLLEWREVEPMPGESFWEYADWLVRAAEYYQLDLVLRLDHPPAWAQLPGTDPPVDVKAYAAFVDRVAARYRGRVTAYIIWNEPNLAAEWGDRPPDPEAYVELLCAAHAAIRTADPEALVVSAGLAPTNHTDASALDDRHYLQRMYRAGAGQCFDVLGAHPYGFAYPPDDPHSAHDGLNLARLADLRAIMAEAGGADTPVWATELGWTTEPVGAGQQWFGVSEEQQSRYLVGAFEQAGAEWPWLERIAVWNLSRGLPAGDEKRGYSLLAGDGTPRPAYEALAEMHRVERGETEAQAGEGQVEVLAPDVVVRLSDVDTYYPHWARPHCPSVPCRHWVGQFHVREPGTLPWRLQMEIMQVDEPGNLVWINGHLLDPPAIPWRGRPDFASVWTVVEMTVPWDLLQPGVNTLEIGSSPRLPAYQDGRARFESLQFRHVRLTTAP
jgi:polysaccharide biosynthesis protein PslG